MQGTSKPTASLSSGLLARRGHARPAMRPQGFVSLTPAQSDDLGWNDMGEEPVAPQPVAVARPVAVAPPAPPVLRQLAALDEQFATEPAVVAPRPLSHAAREATARKIKAAFTLRLDSDRHLRLRLATAVRHQSAQQLVTEALDAFLESLTEVDALARQLAAREGRD
jgi:hypothetical protein